MVLVPIPTFLYNGTGYNVPTIVMEVWVIFYKQTIGVECAYHCYGSFGYFRTIFSISKNFTRIYGGLKSDNESSNAV